MSKKTTKQAAWYWWIPFILLIAGGPFGWLLMYWIWIRRIHPVPRKPKTEGFFRLS